MEELLRNIIYQCVILSIIGGSIWFGWFYHNKLGVADRLAITWYLFDGFMHSILEGLFLYLSIGGTVETSTSVLSHIWKDYGKADRRFLVADPTIVSMMILATFLGGSLAFALVYSIVKDKFYRHYLQISLCLLELFGNWMTIAPEVIGGGGNMSTESFFYFCNMAIFTVVWVVVPVILLVQSWRAIRAWHVPRGRKGERNVIPSQLRQHNLRNKKHS